MSIRFTAEQIIRECRGCRYFNPKSRDYCGYKDKLEFGKEGKCLKKRKPKW